MVFSSALFLVFFLPLFLVAYLSVPRAWKNAVALIGSLIFYTWGAPKFVFLLVASAALDFWLSSLIQSKPDQKKRWLSLGIAVNLGTLFVFKYFNFFVGNAREVFDLIGFEFPTLMEIALPIGISFFTFQKVSYLIDVYRGDNAPAKSFWNYLLFVSLFPQLIAGPIIRYKDLADQIEHRTTNDTWGNALAGLFRFVIGLSKKVLIADVLAPIADGGFDAASLSAGDAWLALLAYGFQIYFDFSGYSDMAIGLGQMMGFRFPENFRWPYTARGFQDFWQRWHITLSTWMRDYLYIPLGGNRGNRLKTIQNLWLVFLFSGLWHGASWNFILWGAWHGLFISLDRFTGLFRSLPPIPNQIFTFFLALLGWIWFRAETVSDALNYFSGLAAFDRAFLTEVSAQQGSVFAIAVVFAFAPRAWQKGLEEQTFATQRAWSGKLLFSIIFLLLCLGKLGLANGQPFIYFRF